MSSVATLNHDDTKSELQRPLADFHPCVWGNYFLQFASESMELDQNIVVQVDTLKNEVKKILASNTEKSIEKINLIDSICRLGVSYHFEHEIEKVLQQIQKSCVENGEIIVEDNLCSLAVLFRRLRQQGIFVSPNVFKKFKDEEGNFSERLILDIEGMLSLYEASHMMVHGEDILEEALNFTSTHLSNIIPKLSPSLAEHVKHSLKQTLHRNIPRLEARRYISIYEQDPSHDEILLTLAKLDFNMVQALHRKEFGNISKWWKEELDIPGKLPYVRDRIVEMCFWDMSVYFEPKYSQARKYLTKIGSILTMLDDTYDAFGTIDELELFAKTIERWDTSILDDLPEYMKLIYTTMIKTLEEIEQEATEEGKLYIRKYYIKEFQLVVQSYLTEARWLNKNYQPTVEEYMNVSKITCCQGLLTTTSYIGMGDIATENIFNWAINKPKIVDAISIVCRVMDEIVTREFEQKRVHVCSLLDCYKKQYDMSKEDSIQECRKIIANSWKDINQECLEPTEVPMHFLTRALNLARFMDVIYKDDDNFTRSEGLMKSYIKAVLVDPVPI